jgi:copper(I)-binding protein
MLLAACSSGDAVSDRDAVEPAAILASAGDISVVAAAAPAPPIETGPMAVYVVLANAGTVPDTLTGVSSPAATGGSVHATRNADGMSGMGPAGPLAIEPGEHLRMGPGGLHIMLDDLVTPVAPGDSILVELELTRAGRLSVTLPVVTYGDVLDRLGAFAPDSR